MIKLNRHTTLAVPFFTRNKHNKLADLNVFKHSFFYVMLNFETRLKIPRPFPARGRTRFADKAHTYCGDYHTYAHSGDDMLRMTQRSTQLMSCVSCLVFDWIVQCKFAWRALSLISQCECQRIKFQFFFLFLNRIFFGNCEHFFKKAGVCRW